MEYTIKLMLMVACLLSPTVAQVSWFLKTTEAKLETNDSIELVCQVTGTCCSSLRSWKDGTGKALITNGVTTLPNKYKETINASSLQFSLLIYNLTVSDLNINYQCQYGFDSSQQYLNMSESIFRYVTQKTEISLLKWNYTGNQLSVAVNLTRVFPEPNCTASFKDNSIFYVPSATTYDKGLFKYTELSMINVGYICPGTLTITCMVGSYPFEVFSGNPCGPTTADFSTKQQSPTSRDLSATTKFSNIIETSVKITGNTAASDHMHTTITSVNDIYNINNTSSQAFNEDEKNIIIIVVSCVGFAIVLIVVGALVFFRDNLCMTKNKPINNTAIDHISYLSPLQSDCCERSLPKYNYFIHQYRPRRPTDQYTNGYCVYNGNRKTSGRWSNHVDLPEQYMLYANAYKIYQGRNNDCHGNTPTQFDLTPTNIHVQQDSRVSVPMLFSKLKTTTKTEQKFH